MNFTFDPQLSWYVYFADLAFVGFAAVALFGGVIAVGARRLIHAVLGLITSLVGVAGIYVYLGTHFIAAMQILIYVGAVSISITFAVMLARPPSEADKDPKILPGKVLTGLAVALFAAIVLGIAVMTNPWRAVPTVVEGTIEQVGHGMLTNYALVFELISLVLLIAIVGSVTLARGGRRSVGGK